MRSCPGWGLWRVAHWTRSERTSVDVTAAAPWIRVLLLLTWLLGIAGDSGAWVACRSKTAALLLLGVVGMLALGSPGRLQCVRESITSSEDRALQPVSNIVQETLCEATQSNAADTYMH